jgi:DNA-directed RNA polymerase specialized sigma24 family protein
MVSDVWAIVIEKVQDGAFHVAVGEKADVNQPKKYVIGIAANIVKRTNASATHETDLTNEEDIPDMKDDFAVADNHMDFAHAAQLLTDPEDLAVLAALLVEKTIPDMVRDFAVPYKTAWRRYHRCLDHCREVLQVANGREAHDVA